MPSQNENPILFSGVMIRALLNGSKNQTRRVVKPQPVSVDELRDEEEAGPKQYFIDHGQVWTSGVHGSFPVDCPYGQPGDRLWVREPFSDNGKEAYFRATLPPLENAMIEKWKPSIFMPRKFSRITLEITDVRVQRLQEISEDYTIAEGIPADSVLQAGRNPFIQLWDSINAKRGFGWDKNVWVWAITFNRIK